MLKCIFFCFFFLFAWFFVTIYQSSYCLSFRVFLSSYLLFVFRSRIFVNLSQPKKAYLDRKWPKINIRLILSYDPSFFMFRARKNQKKYFYVLLTKLGPKFGLKRVILGQIFQKNEKISIFFFDLNDFESKKGQKTMKIFFPY